MKIRGSLLGALAALTLAVFAFAPTLAQPATPEAAGPAGSPEAIPVAADCGTLMGIGTPDDGCLIFINGIADDGGLDLYVDRLKAVDTLRFDDVSGYFALPAGSYSFALVPADQSVEHAIATLDDVEVAAGAAYELAGVGMLETPQLLVSAVDLAPLLSGPEGTPLGATRIRAIHAVPNTVAVDVAFIAGDIAERAFSDLSFGQVSDYVDKLAGVYRVILNTADNDLLTLHLDQLSFEGDTVYSIYAFGDAADSDLRLLVVAVDLTDGVSTAREISPALVSDMIEVSHFSIYEGDCAQLSGTLAFELTGTGYDGAGPGTLAPWGSGGDPEGALGAVPVHYGEGVLDDVNLGDLLGGRTVSVVVHDAATGGVVACGAVGGVVEEAGRFWQHDRLIIGLEPVGESGISGTATFTEDTGILSDKINVSVSLVNDRE